MGGSRRFNKRSFFVLKKVALKDVADLQLPELLLSEARAREPQDRVLAGDHCHCKEALNVNIGGILLLLEACVTP